MKKVNMKALKKKVWSACARYVKARDANNEGYVHCVTCNKLMRWNDPTCHAGHFVSGRCNAVIFDDAFIFSQCYVCNVCNHGEQGKYALFIKKKYGYDDDTIQEVLDRKRGIKKFIPEDLYKLQRHYEEETERLMKEKGL